MSRIVRYGELKPCYNAFIDCRSPGSEAKENFTIIGPGVSENPAQHVHILEPHGFNIGGARQPPGCVNSQHSHETAEVFVVHTGTWRFDFGEHGEDAQITLYPGDVISLPVRTFRGFTNVGNETSFLWAVLGSDDPGRVTWAPKVFEMAKDLGLILLENGQLIDTTIGETKPEDARLMPPTTPDEAATLRRMTQGDTQSLVVRDEIRNETAMTAIIGDAAPLNWPHGFTLDRIDFAPGGQVATMAAGHRADVLFVHRGAVSVSSSYGAVELRMGDTMSLPMHLAYTLESRMGAITFLVRGETP